MNQKNELQSLDSDAGDQELQQMVTRKLAVLKREIFLVIAIVFSGLIVFDVIAYREHAEKIRAIEKVLRRLEAAVDRAAERQTAVEQSDNID